MRWTKWSSIAELLSSIAILVTLVFLTIEIRQNTVAIQANSLDGALAGDLRLLDNLVQDPDLWFLYYKDELTDADKVRLYHHLAAFMRVQERNWLLHRSGALDEAEFATYQSGFVGTLLAPNPRKWWGNLQATTNPGFASYINEILGGRATITADDTLGAFN